MEIIVQKFGGTSVGNSKAIINLYNRVMECDADTKIVVSSAISGVTDLLIKAAKIAVSNLKLSIETLNEIKTIHLIVINELGIYSDDFKTEFNKRIYETKNILIGINYISELTNKILDKILSYGEILSTLILNNYFQKNSQNCKLVDSTEFIKTDSNFGEAKVNWELTKAKLSDFHIQQDIIYIFQGFIGSDYLGNTTTLGRGGSDYTASIIASALKQNGVNIKQIEIWTDVDGIMTSDPRIDKTATTVKEISYDEVLKLSYFGAKVIHPNTVKPAVELNIPVVVRNTFNPNNTGTIILQKSKNNQNVRVNLKDAYLIQLRDFNQQKLIDESHRILNILISSGSIIYYQNISVYKSDIIYKQSNIILNDYLSGINFEIKAISINALIGKINEFEINNKNYIKGINDDIILVFD